MLTPLKDRVLVKRLPEPKSILWIPDIARENSKFAEVLAVGPKVLDVNVGDKVLVPGAASKFPDWESQDVMMIQMADIGGTLND